MKASIKRNVNMNGSYIYMMVKIMMDDVMVGSVVEKGYVQI